MYNLVIYGRINYWYYKWHVCEKFFLVAFSVEVFTIYKFWKDTADIYKCFNSGGQLYFPAGKENIFMYKTAYMCFFKNYFLMSFA